MNHCVKCGSPLEPRSRPTGRFDPWRGQPTAHRWEVCPNWRKRFLGGNGHAWTYRGENSIDRKDLNGVDPGVYENPPRPPGLERMTKRHTNRA